jgi:hypothetical protein
MKCRLRRMAQEMIEVRFPDVRGHQNIVLFQRIHRLDATKIKASVPICSWLNKDPLSYVDDMR